MRKPMFNECQARRTLKDNARALEIEAARIRAKVKRLEHYHSGLVEKREGLLFAASKVCPDCDCAVSDAKT